MGHWRPTTKAENLADADLPDNPRELDCFVCEELIGVEDWDWAAMPENGPIHKRCFMTDAELLTELDDPEPCSGCDTTCKDWVDCSHVDVIGYADGVNNCTIVRPGVERDDIADYYRAQGYKVVH